MQGLNLTFDTLARTRNEAAVDVLITGLEESSPDLRRRALDSLMSRRDRRNAERVLDRWETLRPEDVKQLRAKKQWMAPAIEKSLAEGGDAVLRGIEATRQLGLTSVVPQLILLAESSGSRPLRQAASDAVLEMVEPLGRDARDDRDQPTVRSPVLSRLADSVRRYAMHKNDRLVDSFLAIVAWGDADFRQLLGEKSPQFDLLCRRLADSPLPAVNDLLAGFIRRRSAPPRIVDIIRQRSKEGFRESLLKATGSDPSVTALRNLGEMGLPQCCRGAEGLIRVIAPEHRAALTHVLTATEPDEIRKLRALAMIVETGGPGCDAAAAAGFARCEIPLPEIWMRAAVTVADNDPKMMERDENAQLLQRLIELIDHHDPALVKSVRRILEPLHADHILPRLEALRPRTRRKLGRVILMIDPDAIDRIRDALRHPVLSNRLAASAAADALAIVDLLLDSFRHISREDHQEARMRAADVMADAVSDETLMLLREMVDLPESPVRDAAVDALRRREETTLH